jgi:hypothetical protein
MVTGGHLYTSPRSPPQGELIDVRTMVSPGNLSSLGIRLRPVTEGGSDNPTYSYHTESYNWFDCPRTSLIIAASRIPSRLSRG